jgi:hypothetical protein
MKDGGKQMLATYFHAGFLLGLLFDPEVGSDVVWEMLTDFPHLHCVTSQKF